MRRECHLTKTEKQIAKEKCKNVQFSKPITFGPYTLVSCEDLNTGKKGYGLTKWSSKENFDKKKARSVAKGRALSALYRNVMGKQNANHFYVGFVPDEK